MPSEIGEAEILIGNTIEKRRAAIAAVNALLIHPDIQDLIGRTSASAALQFNLNPQDVSDRLTDKLRTKIHTLKNPNQKPLLECLAAWLHTIADHYCENTLKHFKVEERHRQYVEHAHSSGRHNGVPLLRTSVPTPEDDLIEKEEQSMWESRALPIRETVRRIVLEEFIIADLWAHGEEPKEIAEEIHKSTKTVYRKLRKMQKSVIKEIGIQETRDNKPLIREGMRELFASSLHSLRK
jgi:DNA-binding NtrC family response regulator